MLQVGKQLLVIIGDGYELEHYPNLFLHHYAPTNFFDAI